MSGQNAMVTRAIRRHVRPVLERQGFDDFTGRKAWRRRQGGVIEVVDFQAVGAYSSFGVGCTSFSFAVYAGVWIPECEIEERTPVASALGRPNYYECTFQVILGKALAQPGAFHPYERDTDEDRFDTWAVDEDAGNLEPIITDVVRTLTTTGFPVLDELSSRANAYEALLTRNSTNSELGVPGITMPGAPGSPHWLQTVRRLAAALGRDAEADIISAPVLQTPTS
ncbi:DUF4304 domain-containing protein [Cellulomonas sp. 179-A 4D5 NHS]|uniref:DUF4304 domain-containing protein n=1 Tax=Cellulomonas sp. 179-A 4D5 NHS TaxID=3142378 RepID=UPI00399F006B